MQDGKYLGKITKVSYGYDSEENFGLFLEFSINGRSLMCNSSICYALSKGNTEKDVVSHVKFIQKILNESHKSDVYELLNTPVEISIFNNTFQDFRIILAMILELSPKIT